MASRLLRFSALLQKYRTPVVVACCGGVFAANMFYHVFPDLTYRQLYQAWHKGEPVELTEKLEGLFQQVEFADMLFDFSCFLLLYLFLD